MDRFLGRLSALLRFSFIDGVNDHSSSEYLRLSRQAVINSRVSLIAKTRSVVVDAVQKVGDFLARCSCRPSGVFADDGRLLGGFL